MGVGSPAWRVSFSAWRELNETGVARRGIARAWRWLAQVKTAMA